MDRQLLLAKKEVTYGLDPAAVATNTLWAESITYKVTGQRVKSDPAKPGVGPTASQVYGEHAEVSFKIPLAGSGVAGTAPKWGPVMKACGWAETVVAVTSVTYGLMANPKAADSMTLKWRDGNRRLHLAKGFRGRVGFELTAGNRLMLVITGKGLHTIVSEAGADLAHIDADFTGWLDSKPVSNGTTTFSLAGVSTLGIRELSFDQSDNVRFIDVPGQENVELIGERAFTGKGKTTTPLPSALNYESLWVAGSVNTFAMVHGATAGNIVTVNGRAQIVDPDYSRDNGDDVTSFSLEIVPSSLTTDDDLAIVLT